MHKVSENYAFEEWEYSFANYANCVHAIYPVIYYVVGM